LLGGEKGEEECTRVGRKKVLLLLVKANSPWSITGVRKKRGKKRGI